MNALPRVERKIRKEEKYYQNLATKKDIKVLEGKELKDALECRLSERGITPVKKDIGELNILYVSYIANNPWEEHQILPSLKKNGNLTVYSFIEYGFYPLRSDWGTEREKFNIEFMKFIEAKHAQKPLDVMVTYCAGYEFNADTIKKIGDLGIVVISYHLDDRPSFRGRKINAKWTGPCELAGASDLQLTNSYSSLVKYFAEGGLASFWPEGADADFFKPRDLDFEYDVSFLGVKYGQRPDYIDYLKNNGINVASFGAGWENGAVPADKMPEIYAKSRINLGFSGIACSMKECCLKGRDFEVPMCGALYLTTDQPDIHRVFDTQKEVVVYNNKKDMLQKVKYLLSNPEICAKIRKNVREKCLIEHTWDKRFESVFELCGLLKTGK